MFVTIRLYNQLMQMKVLSFLNKLEVCHGTS